MQLADASQDGVCLTQLQCTVTKPQVVHPYVVQQRLIVSGVATSNCNRLPTTGFVVVNHA